MKPRIGLPRPDEADVCQGACCAIEVQPDALAASHHLLRPSRGILMGDPSSQPRAPILKSPRWDPTLVAEVTRPPWEATGHDPNLSVGSSRSPRLAGARAWGPILAALSALRKLTPKAVADNGRPQGVRIDQGGKLDLD